MELRWLTRYQAPILYFISFAVLASVFGILWAIVLLITIELLENNFEFDINIDKRKDQLHKQYKEFSTSQVRRKYKISQEFEFKSSYISSESTINEMEEKRQRNLMDRGVGESRPSLMSLIKHGNGGNKENRTHDRQQPLLAVVKNNLHLRRRSELSHMSKSPLYKNLVPNTTGRNSPFGVYKSHSPMMSPKIHPSSGWYQNSPVQAAYQSPTLSPSVSFNRSNVYSQLNQSSDFNKSATRGLEVHGSYFLNKSLLHSNLVEDETFSLVNSQFNSPRQNSFITHNTTATVEKKSKPSIDETSTEAVVSILKEKSRRKRVLDEASQHDEDEERFDDSRKRIKFDPLDDTLDNLFPPVQKRKRINNRNVIITKKRLASIGTQYESLTQVNDDSTKPSKTKKSKYGLSEQQTDEMMTDREETPLIQKKSEASKRSREAEELENAINAINHVKESVAKYKKESKTKLVCNGEIAPAEAESLLMNGSDFQTPIKKNDIIKELKTQSTALKSLKSPFKKIFHTFPSNLAPGSAEKRRKHPVYFTAKIDVDDIQSKREEYGDRGASLKAFRLDQEEAKQRVESIFDEDEVDFKGTKTTQSSTLTSSQTPSFGLPSTSISTTSLPVTSAVSSILKPAASKQDSSAGQKVTTSISFNFTPAAAPSTTIPSIVTSTTALPTTLISTANNDPSAVETKKITPKKVSFNFSAATSTTNASLPSLFQSATTTASTISFNTQQASHLSAPQPVSTTGGFSLSNANVAPPALNPAGSGFSFGTTPSVSGTAAPATTTSSAPSSGFSFPSSNATGIKLPSFSEATQSTKASTGFSFAPSTSETKPSASTQPQFPFGAKPTSSISFGAPASSTGATTAPVSNLFAAPTTTPAIRFGVAPSTTTASMAAPVTSTGFSFGAATNTTLGTKPAPTFNFGQTPAAQTTGPSNATANAKPAPTFNFGQSSSGQSIAPSVFGNQAAPTLQPPSQTTTNMFGAPKSVSASTGYSFGSSAPVAVTTTTTVTSGFSFGVNGTTSTAGSAFGAPSTQSVFAIAPAATQNVFGNATSTANMFGKSSAQQNLFNSAATTSTTASVFGKPAASGSGFSFGNAATAAATTTKSAFFGASTSATSTGSIFGQQQATTASVFGQSTAPSASVFGQPTTKASVFGQQTVGISSSVIGQPASTASVFGQAANIATPFGQPSNAGNSVFGQTNTSNNVFGAPSGNVNTNAFGAPSSGITSVFGSSGSTAPTPFGNNTNDKQASVFGAPSNTATANPFGQPSNNNGFNFNASGIKPNTSFNFGSTGGGANAFGAPSTPAKSSFNFVGNQTGTPSFGAPSAPSFGTPQAPNFGTPQAAPFGAPSPAANAFTIGAGGGTGQGAVQGRQTARARRRIRR